MIAIGIDGHNLETERTGVGRYLENLLRIWAKDPQLAGRVHFFIYFKGPVPSDEFLRSPLFTCQSLRVLPRTSFVLYFLFLLPFRAWRDRASCLFFPGYMVSPLWRGRSVLVLHDVSFERFPLLFPLHVRIPYRVLGRYGARRSVAVCTVSEFSKQEIVHFYNIPPAKIHVTYLGVDPRLKRANEEEIEVIKKKYGIVRNYILYLGQVFNRRHVLEAIGAFSKIAPQFPDVQFLVVGTNRTQPFIPFDQIVEEENKKLGRIAILRNDYAPEKDMSALLSGALVGIYLSDYEGFGLPPLEFLTCGTPVMAPNTTSLKEILQGKQIIIENPTDIEEIAQKLSQAIGDDELRKRIQVEGPEYAKQFSWQQCAEKTLRILENEAK